MSTRADCIKWYGEENGNAVADHWEAVRKRIAENPTVIAAPPRTEPYCLSCGSVDIGYKITRPTDEISK